VARLPFLLEHYLAGLAKRARNEARDLRKASGADSWLPMRLYGDPPQSLYKDDPLPLLLGRIERHLERPVSVVNSLLPGLYKYRKSAKSALTDLIKEANQEKQLISDCLQSISTDFDQVAEDAMGALAELKKRRPTRVSLLEKVTKWNAERNIPRVRRWHAEGEFNA
jgi:hypothetical protein